MSIVVKNLSYTYNPKSPYETSALKDVSLTIEQGQFVGICGHTGSGKTTFVQHLNALLPVQCGELYVDGLDLTLKQKKPRREMLKKLRGKVGMVFQYPEHQLFANTVYDDVAFGPTNMGLEKQDLRFLPMPEQSRRGLWQGSALQIPSLRALSLSGNSLPLPYRPGRM